MFSFIASWALILYDNGVQDKLYHATTSDHLPVWLQNVRGLQTGISWPRWSTHIPYLPFRLKLLDTNFLNLNFPAWLVEQGIPIAAMVGLPVVLILLLRWRYGPLGMRGTMYALFTGFMTVYIVLTIVGSFFRGQGMELLPPWSVQPATGLGVN